MGQGGKSISGESEKRNRADMILEFAQSGMRPLTQTLMC